MKISLNPSSRRLIRGAVKLQAWAPRKKNGTRSINGHYKSVPVHGEIYLYKNQDNRRCLTLHVRERILKPVIVT